MACCLTAPSHYLNQCWLIISKVEWHSSKGNFTRDTSAMNHWNYLKNQEPKMSFRFPRDELITAASPANRHGAIEWRQTLSDMCDLDVWLFNMNDFMGLMSGQCKFCEDPMLGTLLKSCDRQMDRQTDRQIDSRQTKKAFVELFDTAKNIYQIEACYILIHLIFLCILGSSRWACVCISSSKFYMAFSPQYFSIITESLSTYLIIYNHTIFLI